MKTFITNVLIVLGVCTDGAHAQVVIPSYSFSAPVYFCNGRNLQPEGVGFAVGVDNYSPPFTPIIIDSFEISSTRNAFTYDTSKVPDTLQLSLDCFETYNPPSPGFDTFRIIAYYGSDTAKGEFTFQAVEIDKTSLEGVTFVKDDVGFGLTDGSASEYLSDDTLHDIFLFPLTAGGASTNEDNKYVQIFSCGGDMIDSVQEIGDFSEISFVPTPTAPIIILPDSIVFFQYEVTPKYVGSFPHYLVFHTVSGYYLVWSFEYTVDAASSVSPIVENSANAMKVFPNPATDQLQILGGPRIGGDAAGTVHLFDIMGRERMTAEDDGTGATLDVSHLEAGTYFLRLGNQSTKIEIER